MGNFLTKGNDEECEVDDLLIISPRKLYNIMSDLQSYSIVFDLRDAEKFTESHIDLAFNCSGVEEMVTLATQYSYTSVILYTSSSDETMVENELLVKKFCARIRQIDRKNPVPIRKIFMPNFELFRHAYPFMCSDSADYEEGRLYPSQITDNVFLSNFGVASSKKVLRRLGITHCVNCTVDCPFVGEVNDNNDSAAELQAAFSNDHREKSTHDNSPANDLYVTAAGRATSPSTSNKADVNGHIDNDAMPICRLRVPVVDESDENISEHFQRAIDFIDAALAENTPHHNRWDTMPANLAPATTGIGGKKENEEDDGGSDVQNNHSHSNNRKRVNRVIIHCKHGQSRSATVAVAWLIASSVNDGGISCPDVVDTAPLRVANTTAVTVESALAYLKQARPKVCPNEGFIKQLHLFANAKKKNEI